MFRECPRNFISTSSFHWKIICPTKCLIISLSWNFTRTNVKRSSLFFKSTTFPSSENCSDSDLFWYENSSENSSSMKFSTWFRLVFSIPEILQDVMLLPDSTCNNFLFLTGFSSHNTQYGDYGLRWIDFNLLTLLTVWWNFESLSEIFLGFNVQITYLLKSVSNLVKFMFNLDNFFIKSV